MLLSELGNEKSFVNPLGRRMSAVYRLDVWVVVFEDTLSCLNVLIEGQTLT